MNTVAHTRPASPRTLLRLQESDKLSQAHRASEKETRLENHPGLSFQVGLSVQLNRLPLEYNHYAGIW